MSNDRLDLDAPSNIVSLELYKSGHYEPSHDVGKVWSRILIVYMGGPPPEKGSLSGGRSGHVEVLASMGASWDWEVSGDSGAALQTLAYAMEKEPDGLYVLHGRMIGSGEDCEFEVMEARALSVEERRWVEANSDFSGVEHLWAREYRDVPCQECKQPLVHHGGYEMQCPKDEKEAAEAKARWEAAWANIVDE